ncbi:MAG: metallophosphoesterase [Aerococcus sp.]|nr:metallophosphoesterase [Aerococcus sp.]
MGNKASIAKRLLTLAGATAVVGGYYYYQNHTLGRTNYWVESPAFDGGLEGLKIVQLSDLNMPHQHVSLDKVIEAAIDEAPDLIALTGNIIAKDETYDEEVLEEFARQLVAIAPTFAVYGSNEIKSPFARRGEQIMTDTGIHFLNDAAETFDFHGTPLTVMGIYEKRDRRLISHRPLRFVKLTDEQKQQPKLLLAHRPEAFLSYHDIPSLSPDLVLTGHAFGGYARLPYLGALYADGQGYQPEYTSGIYALPEDENKMMVISRGIGQPNGGVRINNRPELVTVQLTESVSEKSRALQAAVDSQTRAAGGYTFERFIDNYHHFLNERGVANEEDNHA